MTNIHSWIYSRWIWKKKLHIKFTFSVVKRFFFSLNTKKVSQHKTFCYYWNKMYTNIIIIYWDTALCQSYSNTWICCLLDPLWMESCGVSLSGYFDEHWVIFWHLRKPALLKYTFKWNASCKYHLCKRVTLKWVLRGVDLGRGAAAAGALSLLPPGGTWLPLHSLTGGLPALLAVTRCCFTAHRWHPEIKKNKNEIISWSKSMLQLSELWFTHCKHGKCYKRGTEWWQWKDAHGRTWCHFSSFI